MKPIRTTANKYLVYRDELLALANSAEHKGTTREDALLAGAALLKGKYDADKAEERACKMVMEEAR